MQTNDFTYKVRTVRNGKARLVAYYDKDYDQRPPVIIVKSDAFIEGQEVNMSFVLNPASHDEIIGVDRG